MQRRRAGVWALVYLAASLCSACTYGSSEAPVPVEAELAEQWVTAAIDGDFETAAAFTHGEFGEPTALDRFARSLASYREEYGGPRLSVDDEVHSSSQADLAFVCVRVDYQSFAVEGGLAIRWWDGLGLKVWEFRTAMEGCLSDPAGATTTLPEP